MKKMMRTLGILAMVVLMLTAMAMPTLAASVDYDPTSFMNQYRQQKNRIETMQTIMEIIFVVIILAGIATSVYIFITAPKCGMSRAWALAPVVGNVFGLIAFILVRTASKTTAVSTNTIVCPTCNGIHPAGTQFCNICGTKLQ